jgi:hypothetical protein
MDNDPLYDACDWTHIVFDTVTEYCQAADIQDD